MRSFPVLRVPFIGLPEARPTRDRARRPVSLWGVSGDKVGREFGEDYTVEDRLLPVNALLGLLLSNDVNPPAFAVAGFELAGLEIPATGRAGTVTIDCLLFHAATSHLLLVESKSGANVEEGQATRYGQLQAQAVVQAAYVTLSVRTSPTIETVYLCLAEYLDRVRLGLSSIDLSYPIIAVADGKVTLDGIEDASPQLRGAFGEGEILLPAPPPRLIGFDQDSDVEIIQPRVLAVLVTAMSQRLTQLTLVSLAERATPHFALYGRQAQQQIKRKVGEAVRRIAEAEPGNFAFLPTTGSREGLVKILRTPEDNDARGRTQGYQAIGRASRLRKGGRPSDTSPDQLDLLAELDATDNETISQRAANGEEGQS